MTDIERLNQVKQLYSTRMFTTPFKDEGEFQKHVKEMLELAGAYVIREAFATKRGVSDVIACYCGRFISLELKDDMGSATRQQIRNIERVKAAGGAAAVCRTLSEVFELLEKIVTQYGVHTVTSAL